ncbi:MAG: hypothetical protein ABIH72_01720 [archaeon]
MPYNPITDINPNDDYDKQKFARGLQKRGKLKTLDSLLTQNPNNSEAIMNIGLELRPEDPGFYARDEIKPENRDADIKAALKSFDKLLNGELVNRRSNLDINEGYVSKNWNDLVSKLKAQDLINPDAIRTILSSRSLGEDELRNLYGGAAGLLMTLQLYETGDEKVDNVTKAIQKIKEMAGLKASGQHANYIEEKMKDPDTPDWLRDSYESFNVMSRGYNEAAFESYIEEALADLTKAITKEVIDGNRKKLVLDEKLLEKVLNKNLVKANEKFYNEKKKSKREEIFNKEITPYYMGVGEIAYQRVK